MKLNHGFTQCCSILHKEVGIGFGSEVVGRLRKMPQFLAKFRYSAEKTKKSIFTEFRSNLDEIL